MNNKRIYLDYAAATPLDPRVKEEMDQATLQFYGNPGGLHTEAVRAKEALEAARLRVARILGCHSDEIIFTSGGTESNNLAILGSLKAASVSKSAHVITSSIEHSSVRSVFRHLQEEGIEVSSIGVDAEGKINGSELKNALRQETVLVSIMHANNEIGSIESLGDIAKTIRHFKKHAGTSGPLFHTDAVQSVLYTALTLDRLDVDLVSIDGSKIYGPRGSGILYVRRGTLLSPLFFGGSQERRLRPGTENVAAAIAIAKALEIAEEEREGETERLRALREQLWQGLQAVIPGLVRNSPESGLPHILNLSVPNIDTEFLVVTLDELGIAAATKSACLENEEIGSYVVAALRPESSLSRNTLRFSLGRHTSESDIAATIDCCRQALALQSGNPMERSS